ncbi:MAG: hypothetical protein JO013_02175 [Alphaproteobacteria bacterium]|nr:hypothetical protein [Alphaproteobacteria bacterium]
MLLALLIAAAPPPAAATPTAAAQAGTRIAYVGTDESGRCVYMTGDVGLDAREFRDDLKEDFEPGTALLLYHGMETRPACLAAARRIARSVGFRTVRTAPAPPRLDLGPPL